MEFFWRDIQTIKGAVRAALALPHVDIGELREVERSHAYTVPNDDMSDRLREHMTAQAEAAPRLTIKDARAIRTQQWHAKPPSIAELFALPILSQVAM
ncbi:hypothetical protein ACQKIE_00110 [Luteibacter sp. NPDC031894]|uniref:hypothetical protein n=1 Tax=Luteibacter sp. NPDC031894 TaxID=3390572 RepID=UPI003D036F3A